MKRIPHHRPCIPTKWLLAILVVVALQACGDPPENPPASKPQAPAVMASYYQRFDFIRWKGEGAMPTAGPGVWEVGTQADTIKYVHLHLDRKEPEHLVFERRDGKIRFHGEDPYPKHYGGWMQPYFPDSTLIYFVRCHHFVVEYFIMDRYPQPRQYMCVENRERQDRALLVAAGNFVLVEDTVKLRLQVVPLQEKARVSMADTSSLDSIMRLASWAAQFPDADVMGVPKVRAPSDPIIIRIDCLGLEGQSIIYHRPLKPKDARKPRAD